MRNAHKQQDGWPRRSGTWLFLVAAAIWGAGPTTAEDDADPSAPINLLIRPYLMSLGLAEGPVPHEGDCLAPEEAVLTLRRQSQETVCCMGYLPPNQSSGTPQGTFEVVCRRDRKRRTGLSAAAA